MSRRHPEEDVQEAEHLHRDEGLSCHGNELKEQAWKTQVSGMWLKETGQEQVQTRNASTRKVVPNSWEKRWPPSGSIAFKPLALDRDPPSLIWLLTDGPQMA